MKKYTSIDFTIGLKFTIEQIHLLNVLTDPFSNSLPEKTTKDIRMKFSQCPFLLVATLKSWNLFTNHSCKTKGYFYVLRHVHLVI